MIEDKGLIQVYTGNGKGKTTAALGLCLRASGRGLKCAFIQFLKKRETGEIFSCKKIDPPILFEQFGSEEFIYGDNNTVFKEQINYVEKGLERAVDILKSNEFKVVVLDEIVILPALNLTTEERIMDLLDIERGDTELVLTGRCAWDDLVRRADLVTEMKEVKHYYTRGIPARRGIEF